MVFEELLARARAAMSDAEVVRVSPGLDVSVSVSADDRRFMVRFADGQARIHDHDRAGTISISASSEAWGRVLLDPPPPGYQAFTAFQLANPQIEVAGPADDIARARPALERIFELIVRATPLPAAAIRREVEQIVGRYRSVKVDGRAFDVYFEEAGQGTPILFLHTAGADGRQFRDQLADTELAQDYRMVAVDLPFHGRSMPPLDWDGAPYRLTKAMYLGWCSAILRDIVGERAIVVGGSMGAAMAMVLAGECPELLLGAVAIEPPYQSPGRKNPYQHHVSVHGALHNSAYVRGLMSPMSPIEHRRRASWIYSQGAPGVYPGDLTFYSEEFDGAVVAPKIDGIATPTVLLSGEYDYSATPADGAKLAELIPGCLHVTMPGLGHFPMCENPDYFRTYLRQALDFVEQNRA